MLNNKLPRLRSSTRRRVYCVKECYYTKTLYNINTKERYTININNDYVTKDLCEMLVKYNYNLISCIPKDLHTEKMYNNILKKNKRFFQGLSMNEKLREKYLTIIVNFGEVPMGYHHPENLKCYTIDNYVTEISRHPYYLKYVPCEQHINLFGKLPESFFTIKTLKEFYDLKIDITLFKKYFKNIIFYRITDPKTGPITRYYIDNSHLDDGYGLSTGTGWYDLPSNNLTYDPKEFLHRIDRKNPVNIQKVEICDTVIIEFPDFNTVTVPEFSIIGNSNIFDPSNDQYINCNMNLE